MSDSFENYTFVGEKVITYEIKSMIWCNTMDLLAIINKENLLEMHRINYKNQKIFQVEESNNITYSIFSPDGKLFILTSHDGSHKILKTENGEILFNLKKSFTINPIISTNWLHFNKIKAPQLLNPFKNFETLDHLIFPIGPHIFSEKTNLAKLNYFNEIPEDSTMIVLSDEKGFSSMALNGIFSIAKYNITDFLGQIEPYKYNENEILYTFLKQETDEAYILLSLKSQTNPKLNKLALLQIDTSILSYCREEITTLGYLLGFIDEHIVYMKNTFQSITAQLKDIQKAFYSKIAILEDCLKNQIVNSTPFQELSNYLKTGALSNGLSQYFGKELFDCKILQKMDETLNNAFSNIQDFIIESILNAIERVIVLLNSLENSVKEGDKFNLLGLDEDELKKLSTFLSKLHIKSDQFLMDITEAKINVRNLIVWMNKSVIKNIENDAEIENMKSYLNKFNYDVDRLYHLLEDENVFYLKHLFDYFTDSAIRSHNNNKKIEKQASSRIDNIYDHDIKEDIEDTLDDYLYNEISQSIERQINLCSPIYNIGNENNPNDHPKSQIKPFNELFNIGEIHSFKFLLQNVEDLWRKIYSRPSSTIPKTFKSKRMIDLGAADSSNSLIAHTFQDNTSELIEIAYTTKLQGLECIMLFKYNTSNSKNNQTAAQIAIIQTPRNYAIKDMTIVHKNTLLLLLVSNFMTENSGDKPHSIVGLIHTDQLNTLEIKESNNYLKVIDSIISKSNQITTNAMDFKKIYRIDSVNVSKLKGSQKGLISVIVDDNKIVFLME